MVQEDRATTWLDGRSPSMETIYTLIKKRNSLYIGPAGHSADVEQGISFLRSQHEETYKQLIAPMISYFLHQLVEINDSHPLQRKLGVFNASSPPDVSIVDYLARIVKYTPCSAECYLLALIFIDRVTQKQGVRANSHNIHRLFLAAILISAKLLDDSTYNNKYYSHVGGITIKELNILECKLLTLLNYDLNVPTCTFELYRSELELQLIRQMRAQADSIYSMEEMSRWEREDTKHQTGPEQTHAQVLLRSKRLRRSRSFTNPVETQNIFRRKNRSISFTILGLVSPSATANA